MRTQADEILEKLEDFRGTEMFYKSATVKCRYTEGIKYLAETAHCYWMLSDSSIVAETLMKQSYFITVDFKRLTEKEQQKEKCEAVIIYSDGNDNVLKTQKYISTDFPLDELRMFYVDNTLLLPSEY